LVILNVLNFNIFKKLNKKMLHKIIAASIKHKLIVGLFTIALIICGLFEVTRLPIDAVPDMNRQITTYLDYMKYAVFLGLD